MSGETFWTKVVVKLSTRQDQTTKKSDNRGNGNIFYKHVMLIEDKNYEVNWINIYWFYKIDNLHRKAYEDPVWYSNNPNYVIKWLTSSEITF